jgi:RNA polymerase sigma-70 factor, ECF subfamily
LERSTWNEQGASPAAAGRGAAARRDPGRLHVETFERVLAAARVNAEWAWDALYRAHAPALLGYLRSQNAPAAEDLLGEVFVSVVRDLHRFSGGADAFRGWTFRIAQNRLIDARRAEARRPRSAGGELPDLAAPGGAGDRLERDEALALLGVLPDEQRAVLYLRFVAELSQREIADVLGKRVGAVKMLQRRAQDRLAQELGVRRYLLDGSDA